MKHLFVYYTAGKEHTPEQLPFLTSMITCKGTKKDMS